MHADQTQVKPRERPPGSCPPQRDCEPHPGLPSSLHTPQKSGHQGPSATFGPSLQNETFCFNCMDRSIIPVNLGPRSFRPRTFQRLCEGSVLFVISPRFLESLARRCNACTHTPLRPRQVFVDQLVWKGSRPYPPPGNVRDHLSSLMRSRQ
jgi:hypothetical protein